MPGRGALRRRRPFAHKLKLVGGDASSLRWADTGVFRHAQIVEDPAHAACELSHFLGDAPRPAGFDLADGEAAQAGDVFRPMADADAAAVLIKVPIENVVATVLDAPVASVDLENTRGVGFFWFSAGNAVGDFGRALTAFLLHGVPFDDERLPHVGEVEVVIEFGRSPDLSDLDPSVISGRALNKIGFLPVFEA